jgi:hypothetical protein
MRRKGVQVHDKVTCDRCLVRREEGPTRFRQPAIATATLGRSASVAIDVAIAFALSWKPFVKSKTNAVITTTRHPHGCAHGGRGQTDAPTASPPPARLGLDLHDGESAVF